MFRAVRYTLLAAPLLLTACADQNKKPDAHAEDYSYNPPPAKSTDTNYSRGSTYTPSTTSGTNTSSGYTGSGYSGSYVDPGTSTPTSYSQPPANSASGTGSSTMKVSDESLAPRSTPKSKTGTHAKSTSGTAGAGGKTYTVKQGDTLGSISQKYYGSAQKWEKIYNANKAKISDPKKLQIGTKLIIP